MGGMKNNLCLFGVGFAMFFAGVWATGCAKSFGRKRFTR